MIAAALHLFFARFISYFLYDIGVSPVLEPFDRLLPQGIVCGRSFKRSDSGKYVEEDDVVQTGKEILNIWNYFTVKFDIDSLGTQCFWGFSIGYLINNVKSSTSHKIKD